MSKLIALLFLIASATAIEIADYQNLQELKKPPIPILKQSFEQHHEGYQFRYKKIKVARFHGICYETGNGIHAQESAYFKNKGDKKNEILVQQGTITYHDEHGHPITLSYIADENGFQPQGAHLPTPPPIPEEIQKSLVHHPQHQQYLKSEDYVQEYQ